MLLEARQRKKIVPGEFGIPHPFNMYGCIDLPPLRGMCLQSWTVSVRSKHRTVVLNGEQVISNLRRPSRHLGATNRLHDLPVCRIAFTRCVQHTPKNLQNLSGGLVLTPGRGCGVFTYGRTSTWNFLLQFCTLSKCLSVTWHAEGLVDSFCPVHVWLTWAVLLGYGQQASSVASWCLPSDLEVVGLIPKIINDRYRFLLTISL